LLSPVSLCPAAIAMSWKGAGTALDTSVSDTAVLRSVDQ
jgi:hypothetical protein